MARNKKTSESLFTFMNLLIALLLKNGTTQRLPHRYISAPSKAQKWMKLTPESWHRYDLKR